MNHMRDLTTGPQNSCSTIRLHSVYSWESGVANRGQLFKSAT